MRSIVRRTRPVRKLTMAYNNRKALEARAMVDQIEEIRGCGYPVLIRDWRHYSVTDQVFGVGDGTSAGKQLKIAFGGSRSYDFPVKYLDEDDATLIVKSNGVVKAISTKVDGLIVPTTAWANGETLTWTGSYYVPCRLQASFQDVRIDGPSGLITTIAGMAAIEDINA